MMSSVHLQRSIVALPRPFVSSPFPRLSSARRHFSAVPSRRQELRDAYIVSASRTPTGAFNGSLSSLTAPQLGAVAIKSAVAKSNIPSSKLTSVYFGQVLQGNSGQAPARQAAILAGLGEETEATTVNKVCSSGLKAVALAAQQIQLGLEDAVVAGGMESMSRVPYYLPRAAQQPAFGDQKLQDGLIKDGLWDVYNQVHMGNCAENTAKTHNISRESQDSYAISSYERAQKAWRDGLFTDEVAPVTIPGKRGKPDTVISQDEGFDRPQHADKLAALKPAFLKDGSGTITAANSSTLNDGASALVLASAQTAHSALPSDSSSPRVLARIVATADAALSPIDFPIAPSKVVPILLQRAGLSKSDIAIWEFNEAFAAVIRANAQILGLDGEADAAKVNPRGGAIALGHALGSSGSRILVTLLHSLEVGQYGVAAICNGGGAASGMVVQRLGKESLNI